MSGYVYFLRPVGAEGPVKIGSTMNPNSRLQSIQACSPLLLEVVAVIGGGSGVEWRFHAKFKHLHSHGEWFRADPELTADIEAVRAGTFDYSTLPAKGWRFCSPRGPRKPYGPRRKAA